MAKVDSLTAAGAQVLAEQIKRFWAEKGWNVVTRIEIEIAKDRGGSRIVGVRSDMIGGLPRERYSGPRDKFQNIWNCADMQERKEIAAWIDEQMLPLRRSRIL